ncbi:MAG: c-type cytochrome [Betaproteobacteria bacterium]|nr:c-type cytochrome [Betaproteobacteria bacterium]
MDRDSSLKQLALIVAGLSIGLLAAPVSHAADVASIAEQCAACHGKDGASKESTVPSIGGFSATYLVDSMKTYKKKERPCVETKYLEGPKKGQKSDMCKVAADLNAADTQAVAKYLAGKKFVRAKQPFDAAKAQQGKNVHNTECKKCHEKGGSSADDDAGILAGQWAHYLKEQFVIFRAGKRPMDEKMKPKLEKLSKEDEDALVHYYASQQ